MTPPREERGAPELLSLKETATLLGLSERSVRRLLDERRIPYYQVTDYTRKVDRADALAYLEGKRGKRRKRGTGSISKGRSGWTYGVRLKDGRRIRRVARTIEDAEASLVALIRENRDSLSRPYRRRPKPARTTVGARQRFRILERDGFRCRYCGATSGVAQLVVDHVVSVADGGTDEDSNLVTACEPCNLGKGRRSLER